MTETVRQTLIGLLELRDLDRELTRLHKRCEECPALIEKNNRDVEHDRGELDTKRQVIQTFKKELHQNEVDLKVYEEKITKLNHQLVGARTNQEYSAIQDQTLLLEKKKGDVETWILEALDQLDTMEKTFTESEQEFNARLEEFKDLKGALEKDLTEYESEAGVMEQERRDKMYNLDPDALKVYDRVRKALGGDGIVSVDGRTCGGCYMAITNNDFVRVVAMREIVLCKSCQRILYPSDLKTRER